MDLKKVKGVVAIPPEAERTPQQMPSARKLSGEQLEAFQRAGWTFVATEEFDPSQADSDPDVLEGITCESDGEPVRSEAMSSIHPRRVYRNAAGNIVIEGASLVVKFIADISRERIQELLAEFGLEVQRALPFAGNGYKVRPSSEAASNDLVETADRLQARPEVEYAEPANVEAFEPRQ